MLSCEEHPQPLTRYSQASHQIQAPGHEKNREGLQIIFGPIVAMDTDQVQYNTVITLPSLKSWSSDNIP
jgi:hypothetical protein